MSDLYDHNIEIIKIPPKLLLHFFFFNETLLFSFAGNVILPQSKGTHEMCKSLDGRYFVEGETWHLDNCTQCICHNGSILCETHACPPVLCSYPTILPNSCCPVCKGQALSNHSNIFCHVARVVGDILISTILVKLFMSTDIVLFAWLGKKVPFQLLHRVSLITSF